MEQDKSFHINMRYYTLILVSNNSLSLSLSMRCSYGRSLFIRCEVILKGATYHVIFSDASDYPPPFKLENLSQVYQ